MIYVCKKCNLVWYYPVKKCLYCRGRILGLEQKKYKVKGTTEVFIASKNHPQVPYYVLLLEDENGNFHIKKSFKQQEIGDILIEEKKEKAIKEKIGVIGAGIMGTGITQILACSGFKVIFIDKSEEFLSLSIKKIEQEVLKNNNIVEKNKIIRTIKTTTKLDDLKSADIVIEAITEDIRLKKELFRKLDKILSKSTIITTNTSSLSIDDLVSAISKPERFVGMHFFNPVSKMNLVEVIVGRKTSETTIDIVKRLIQQINKTPIVAKDSPCFVVNRMLIPYLNEAMWELKEGVACAVDIDMAAKLGLNHPMGPLALSDLIGLDVVLAIMNNLYQKTKNKKYQPCPILEEMVKEGKLGRKTKEGFYKY